MINKPDSNNSDTDEGKQPGMTIHGDNIVINGDVRNGVVVGRGTMNVRYLGGDGATLNGQNDGASQDRDALFIEKLEQLHALLEEARKAGELDPSLAEDALVSLEDTVNMLRNDKKPAKGKIVSKLEYIGDIIDTAVDLLGAGGGVATILGRTLPLTSLLVKLATRIF